MFKKGTVVARNGEFTTFVGEGATNLYRLITLKHALMLEMKGIRVSRHRSILAVAKVTTGLNTSNRQLQLEELEKLIEKQKAMVEFREE